MNKGGGGGGGGGRGRKALDLGISNISYYRYSYH